MSRTYVHAPWWVKERSPLFREFFVEYHNHRGGPCDLPTYLAAGPDWVPTSCYLQPQPAGRNVFCNCDMCSGRRWRRRIHRQARAAWRAAARDAAKTAPQDRDGLDSPIYWGRSTW